MTPPRFAGHLLQRLDSTFAPGQPLDRQVVLDQALQFFFAALPWPWSSQPVSTFDRQLIERLVDRFIQRRTGKQTNEASTEAPPPPAGPDEAPPPPARYDDRPAEKEKPAKTADDSNVIEIMFRIKLPPGVKFDSK